MKQTFTSKLSGLGFNPKQIKSIQNYLYYRYVRTTNVERVAVVNGDTIRFYCNEEYDFEVLETKLYRFMKAVD